MNDYQFHVLLSVLCYIAYKVSNNSFMFWTGLCAALIAFASAETSQAFWRGLMGKPEPDNKSPTQENGQ